MIGTTPGNSIMIANEPIERDAMRMGESDGRADIVSGTFIASLDAVHISGLGSGHAGFGLLVFRPLALLHRRRSEGERRR